MNAEFFAALGQLEKEKGIPKEYMIDKVSQALLTAYKREYGLSDNVFVEPNEAKKEIIMYLKKTVVADVYDPDEEISLEEAMLVSKKANVGDIINVPVETRSFGRIAAQTAKQVIIQGIREAERGMVLNEFSSKEHEILSATIHKVDPRNGNVILEIISEGERVEAILTQNEQVRNEPQTEGMRIKVYVVEVKKGARGPQVLISRTHPGLVRRLFELEVPEIADGTVEIKSIAREAGNRTKIAVISTNENVDPIGACIGPKRSRINNILEEINGEKIDIVKYSDDMAQFVAAALAPSDVTKSVISADGKSCKVLVPDDQLSLAIGKEGQNARLAAKLTGCKIDIKAESEGLGNAE